MISDEWKYLDEALSEIGCSAAVRRIACWHLKKAEKAAHENGIRTVPDIGKYEKLVSDAFSKGVEVGRNEISLTGNRHV